MVTDGKSKMFIAFSVCPSVAILLTVCPCLTEDAFSGIVREMSNIVLDEEKN